MRAKYSVGLQWPIVFLTAIILLAADGAVFASGSSESSAKSTSAPVTITVAGSQEFHVSTNSWYYYQPTINAFEAQNPGVTVQLLLLPDPQTTQTLQTQLATGEPSDIMFYNKVSAENELDAETNMTDLSTQPWVGRLKQPSLLTSPNGKIYGFNPVVPTDGQGIAYNVDIFKKLNLSPPTTYQQLLSVCDTLKANGYTPFYGPFKDVWTFQIWPTDVWGVYAAKQNPGLWDKINKNQVKWTDVPELTDLLSRGENLVQKGYFQPSALSDDYNGAPAAMSSGKYGMIIIGGVVFISDMAKKDPSLHLGFFPMPAFDDPSMNIIAQSQLGPLLFVPKQGKHVSVAEKFINFISQQSQIQTVTSVPEQSFLPNLKDVPAPTLQPINQQVYDNYVKSGKVATEANAYMKVDLNDLWKYYQDMIGGTMTPTQVMQAWNGKFDELMKAKGFPGF